MTTSRDVRSAIVDALRLDLIGPWSGHAHEDEILHDPPSHFYLTGFLVPFQARGTSSAPDDEESVEMLPKKSGVDDDRSPDRASGRRARMPSSMGLSVLVGPDCKSIFADVTWGDYRRTDRRPGEAKPDEKAEKTRPQFAREPRHEVVELALSQLSDSRKTLEVPSSDGLKIVVHRRVVTDEAGARLHLKPGTSMLSIFLMNDRDASAETSYPDERFAYQAQVALRSKTGFLCRPNARGKSSNDEDEQLADLRYRDVGDWAVGHNVSTCATLDADGTCRSARTEWIPTWEVEKVEATSLQDVELGMEALADCENAAAIRTKVEPLLKHYAAWIAAQQKLDVGPGQRENVKELLVEDARFANKRIAAGLDVLEANAEALFAFRLMNRVMATQARQRDTDGRYVGDVKPTWRLFQLAFVLMNLRGIVDPTHAERQIVDLIFFPTGGGKTEAYLGLAAFTLIYRRRIHPGLSSAGVSVLMRYTLRLLTLDQLSRAATLICALELERQNDVEKLGKWPFEIGLWVGQASTPNRLGRKGDKDENSAKTRVQRYQQDEAGMSVPIPLDNCPWCGSKLGGSSFQLLPNADYPTKLRITCTKNRRCVFSRDNPLPIVAVDDELYRRLPCFIVATVDKFASLPWTGQTAALFGRVERADSEGFYGACDVGVGSRLAVDRLPPPDLIIQDELHLISGPLGTVAGLYEAAIDELASDGGARPKVVASTATVRRARTQIQALFARSDVKVFPPPGPQLQDSFFAVTKPVSERPGRLYVGIAAQGRSGKVMMHRAYLALLAAAQRQYAEEGGDQNAANPADPYMSVLGYFNSLRELGGARRIVEDEVQTRLRAYGTRLRVGERKGSLASRTIRADVVELTSRVTTSDVAKAKRRLGLQHRDPDHIDIALATNMISVGLDITRLGLMVVMGQPVATAEYIQATSRVGRDDTRPGLVVTLLNVHKPRDRSHFERFESYHQSFYRSVEATSVTPFAPRAIDRSIAGVTIALARHLFPVLTPPQGAARIWDVADEAKKRISKILHARVMAFGGGLDDNAETVAHRVTSRAEKIIEIWQQVATQQQGLGGLQFQREIDGPAALLHTPLDPERLTLIPKAWQSLKAHRSLRDVEPTVNLWMKRIGEEEIEADADEETP